MVWQWVPGKIPSGATNGHTYFDDIADDSVMMEDSPMPHHGSHFVKSCILVRLSFCNSNINLICIVKDRYSVVKSRVRHDNCYLLCDSNLDLGKSYLYIPFEAEGYQGCWRDSTYFFVGCSDLQGMLLPYVWHELIFLEPVNNLVTDNNSAWYWKYGQWIKYVYLLWNYTIYFTEYVVLYDFLIQYK